MHPYSHIIKLAIQKNSLANKFIKCLRGLYYDFNKHYTGAKISKNHASDKTSINNKYHS
jgi:hypothetical protein